jgi:hypothetical protein
MAKLMISQTQRSRLGSQKASPNAPATDVVEENTITIVNSAFDHDCFGLGVPTASLRALSVVARVSDKFAQHSNPS